MALRTIVRRLLETVGLLQHSRFEACFVSDNPQRSDMLTTSIYIVGDQSFQKWAAFTCPCGCGETILLSLSQKRRPRWTVALDWFGRPTLHPSVRQTAGCYSHFWLRKGQVSWCPDTGQPEHVRGDRDTA